MTHQGAENVGSVHSALQTNALAKWGFNYDGAGSNWSSTAYWSTSGASIVDQNGNPVTLKGIAITSMVPEAYHWGFDGSTINSGWKHFNDRITGLTNATVAQNFWNAFYAHYVTESDFAAMQQMGFNHVRVNFWAQDLVKFSGSTGIEITAASPGVGVNDFGGKNGFTYLDQLVAWAKLHKIKVILDMHGAFGGQNEGCEVSDNCTPSGNRTSADYFWGYSGTTPTGSSATNQNKTIEAWRVIANHYKNEPAVLGYEYLNEPVTSEGNPSPSLTDGQAKLQDFYKRCINVTRGAGATSQLHFIEDNAWGPGGGPATDSSGTQGLLPIPGLADNTKVVYTFHYYWGNPLVPWAASKQSVNYPAWESEHGEDSNEWDAAQNYKLLNNKPDSNGGQSGATIKPIGYNVWGWKKVGVNRNPYILPGQVSTGWENARLALRANSLNVNGTVLTATDIQTGIVNMANDLDIDTGKVDFAADWSWGIVDPTKTLTQSWYYKDTPLTTLPATMDAGDYDNGVSAMTNNAWFAYGATSVPNPAPSPYAPAYYDTNGGPLTSVNYTGSYPESIIQTTGWGNWNYFNFGALHRSAGVDFDWQAAAPLNGTYYVQMKANNWLNYTLHGTGLGAATNLKVEVYVSAGPAGSMQLSVAGASQPSVSVNTGGNWQWVTIAPYVALNEGTLLKVTALADPIKFKSIRFSTPVQNTCTSLNANCGTPPNGIGGTLASCGTCSTGQVCSSTYQCVSYAGAPYGGTAPTLPATIQAGNYDTGGEGVAYHDTDAAQKGGTYRSTEGVDVEGNPNNIGYTAAGEWTNYSVNNPSASNVYSVVASVAATAGNNHFSIKSIPAGGSPVNIGTIEVPNTAAWSTYANVTLTNVTLPAGNQVIQINDDTGGFNVASLQFSIPPTSVPYPDANTPAAIPGTINAWNYDSCTGGGNCEGISYHDADATQQGGTYRSTQGVDVEGNATPTDIGYSNPGEWVNFTANATAGTYSITASVASASGGSFHIGILQNGTSRNVGTITVPNTGGWTTYQNVVLSSVSLTAGKQVVQVAMDSTNVNFKSLTFAVACTPACSGKVCGSDGCGGSCGTCPTTQACNGSGQCVCTPNCTGKTCGSDGCGGSCGTVGTGQQCVNGNIVTCSCTGKTCGTDGCGNSCGTCAAGQACNASNQCQSVCTPNCTGKSCGSDGCGGTCGTCPTGQSCNAAQACICQPNCTGKTCGSDGCGGTCGTCGGGTSCNSSGSCVASTPCGGLCSNPINIDGNNNPAVTGAICYEKTTAGGGNVGGQAGKNFKVNNQAVTADGNISPWPSARNGGYCFQSTGGMSWLSLW